MKYVSIDIETTGLSPENHSILSVGAIIEDTELKLPYDEIPKFHAILIQREITGSPFAINMNQGIISLISDYINGNEEVKKQLDNHPDYIFCEPSEVSKKLFDFLFLNGYGYDTISGGMTVRIVNGKSLPVFGSNTKPIHINVAGKNFGTFDKIFLEKLDWFKKLINIRTRIIDPAPLFCDWVNDKTLPNFKTCKERSNISGEVAHNALEDAWDVIQMLRTKY